MKKPKFITEFEDIPEPRRKMKDLPVDAREGNFIEVEKGFTEEEALAEARRCLSCRRCIGCGLCVTGCPHNAAELHRKPEEQILHPPEDFSVWEEQRLHNRGLKEI